MIAAVDYSAFQERAGEFCDGVFENGGTLFIKRPRENLVLLSESAYSSLLENAHLLSDKANREWLLQSKAQFERGEFAAHELL